jgi:hypothetical protein
MAKLKPGDLSRSIQKDLGDINKKFWAQLKVIGIAKIITSTIEKGISAVEGAAPRFAKYSQSYIDAITGKTFFFKKGGKTMAISALDNDTLRGLDAPKGYRKSNAKTKAWVKQASAKKFGNKKRSPVSMKLTGKMLNSLNWASKVGTLQANDEKWDYHNAPDGERAPNMPERRLLPDRKGEQFNRRIQQKITEALADAIGLPKGKVKKMLSIKFIIK